MWLSDFIQDTVIHGTGDWDYYGSYQYGNSNDTINIIRNSPKKFIYDYFRNGAKEVAFELLGGEQHDIMALFSDFRAKHTISAFYIGIFLEKSLRANASQPISVNGRGWHMPFSYLWFLTCLYHDYGYCIEDDKETIPTQKLVSPYSRKGQKPFFRSECALLHSVRKKYDIKYSIYSDYPRQWRHEDNLSENEQIVKDLTKQRASVQFSNGTVVSKPRYSSGLVTRYFNYCLSALRTPVVNHGIIGGQLFYDRMIKAYLDAYVRSSQYHYVDYKDFCFDGGGGRGRHFFIEQIPVFKHIADCIIAHNIWCADDSTAELYSQYRLDELLSSRFAPIAFSSNPILFVLAIADTIEPCKLFDSADAVQSPWDIWREYDIDYRKAKKTFIVRTNSNQIDKLYNKAKSLEAWVAVSVTKCTSNSRPHIEIKIL